MPAVEAKEMGIVNFIHDREEIEKVCLEYALNIAANAPLTVKSAKAALNAWEPDSRAEEVNQVRAIVNACFNSEDYIEGRKAFAAKRKPTFSNK